MLIVCLTVLSKSIFTSVDESVQFKDIPTIHL